MDLDVKALGFVALALDHWIAWHEEQLRRSDLSVDDRSELSNDMYYLRSLLSSFQSERERLTAELWRRMQDESE